VKPGKIVAFGGKSATGLAKPNRKAVVSTPELVQARRGELLDAGWNSTILDCVGVFYSIGPARHSRISVPLDFSLSVHVAEVGFVDCFNMLCAPLFFGASNRELDSIAVSSSQKAVA
jgi:hypothetical protein